MDWKKDLSFVIDVIASTVCIRRVAATMKPQPRIHV
jgi:hypothetical protein